MCLFYAIMPKAEAGHTDFWAEIFARDPKVSKPKRHGAAFL